MAMQTPQERKTGTWFGCPGRYWRVAHAVPGLRRSACRDALSRLRSSPQTVGPILLCSSEDRQTRRSSRGGATYVPSSASTLMNECSCTYVCMRIGQFAAVVGRGTPTALALRVFRCVCGMYICKCVFVSMCAHIHMSVNVAFYHRAPAPAAARWARGALHTFSDRPTGAATIHIVPTLGIDTEPAKMSPDYPPSCFSMCSALFRFPMGACFGTRWVKVAIAHRPHGAHPGRVCAHPGGIAQAQPRRH